MEKKRVLFIVPSITNNNGIITFIKNYISNKKIFNDYEFAIYSSKYNLSKELVDYFSNINVKIYYYLNFKKNITKFIKTLKKFYKNNRFDIVHSNIEGMTYFHFKYCKKYCNAKIIWHSHATKSSSNVIKNIVIHTLNNLSKKYVDYNFACSNAAGLHLFKSNKFVKIYNAISFVDNYGFYDLREKYNISKEKHLIGFVGRLSKQKNPLFVLSIARQLPNYIFFIIGNGLLKSKIENEINEKKIKNVILSDAIPNANTIFKNFDAILMPSLFEGLPLVAIEAQAKGVFVILSSNITKEVAISNYVDFLDVDNSQSWIDSICKTKPYFSFNSEKEKYDIIYQTTRLKNLYDHILLGDNIYE